MNHHNALFISHTLIFESPIPISIFKLCFHVKNVKKLHHRVTVKSFSYLCCLCTLYNLTFYGHSCEGLSLWEEACVSHQIWSDIWISYIQLNVISSSFFTLGKAYTQKNLTPFFHWFRQMQVSLVTAPPTVWGNSHTICTRSLHTCGITMYSHEPHDPLLSDCASESHTE